MSFEQTIKSIAEICEAGKVQTAMILSKSEAVEIRDNPPDVNATEKQCAQNETSGITTSFEHRYMGEGENSKQSERY